MNLLIDSDTHLFEPSGMWQEYVDPADRDVALHMAKDDLGYTWLMFGDRRLSLGGPHRPGDVDGIGVFRQRLLDGLPAEFDLDEFTASYSDPEARLLQLDRAGFDASIMFPNYGISWERPLQHDLRATLANMTAWNRWIVEIAAKGGGRLYPVAHLSLRNLAWFEAQLATLADGGIRLALIAPSLVDGRPLSHPELDRAWAAFVDHGITPVFHVANQASPIRRGVVRRGYGGGDHTAERCLHIDGRRPRDDRPDPERCSRALPRSSDGHHGTIRDVGAAAPADDGWWLPPHGPLQRGIYRTFSHAKRILPTSGAGCSFLVRAAAPIDGTLRRHLHGVQ